MGNIGNTFKGGSVTGLKRARKVWREIHDVYPGGGVITVTADWISKGVIPAGTPVTFNTSTKAITAYSDATLASTDDLSTLGINGYLQEDAYLDGVTSASDIVATGTVVYRGEIYEYMFSTAIATKLKALTTVPGVVFVQ